MALVYSKPEIARAQILKSASRQFEEGDVQHWWHPPTGRGVRTHCSDDLLWLPYVTSFYIEVTGDESILNEEVKFINAKELAEGQEDSYTQPAISKNTASLLEHCCRSLDRSLKVGIHGLPLMGAGDWNDGMSRVGHLGKGESVWMGWFLLSTLKNFIPYCAKLNEDTRVAVYKTHMTQLQHSIEENAWDGDWYRRAYFDDGSPLGSASNLECKIDSIAQSWSVLSGFAKPERAIRAMASLDEYLVHRGDGLVKLFTPPFDQSSSDPGYIKGYLPGVRENGGQYTHAALWALMAFAKLKDSEKAGELFSLLNPINHSSTRAGLHKYKVEPYVAAADVYGISPHVGRGGWTWYTGSASWMYRAALESILGFHLKGDTLQMNPCIPKFWIGFEINFKWETSHYLIVVKNAQNLGTQPKLKVDDVFVSDSFIKLVDDGKTHRIDVFVE